MNIKPHVNWQVKSRGAMLATTTSFQHNSSLNVKPSKPTECLTLTVSGRTHLNDEAETNYATKILYSSRTNQAFKMHLKLARLTVIVSKKAICTRRNNDKQKELTTIKETSQKLNFKGVWVQSVCTIEAQKQGYVSHNYMT